MKMLCALADPKGLSVVAFNLNPVDPEADGGFACVVSDYHLLVVAYYLLLAIGLSLVSG